MTNQQGLARTIELAKQKKDLENMIKGLSAFIDDYKLVYKKEPFTASKLLKRMELQLTNIS